MVEKLTAGDQGTAARTALEAYEEWHGQYEVDTESNSPWHRLVKQHLDIERDLAGKRILEIGCGQGGFSCWMARQPRPPAEIVAADFARTAVQKGKVFADQHGLSRITWQVADIQSIAHEDASFDTVISCETIEHVPDPRRAIRELARVLKPGGHLLLTTPNYLGTIGLYRFYLRLTGRRFSEEGQPINNFMLLPFTRAWIASAGLRVRAIDAVGHYLPFPGRAPIEVPAFNDPRILMRWFAHHSLVIAEKPIRKHTAPENGQVGESKSLLADSVCMNTDLPVRDFRGSSTTKLIWVLLFYLSFFLLMSSGRLASRDAGAQLQATMLLINTGSLGTTDPPDHAFWVANGGGKFFESHDIGNIVLMLPAAWIGSVFANIPPAEQIAQPPILSKVGVALTYACLSAVGCFFLCRLFGLFYEKRLAFLLSLGFVTMTFFWAYTKGAWDVLGASCMVCILLYYSAKILFDLKPTRSVIWASLALAGACSFRFSLLPFLGLSFASVLWISRRKLAASDLVACALTFVSAMLPTLVYNYVRMGSPIRPATTASQYIVAGTADLSGNILAGLYGLIISPNKGLLIFAPIFGMLVFLPKAWSRLSNNAKLVTLTFGLGAFLHILFLSKLRRWGSFGWGPRYLVPILPVLFFITCIGMVALWKQYRILFAAFICLSAILNVVPAITNWHLALTEFPQASNPYAVRPYQHAAVWNGLILGLRGKPLPAPAETLQDPVQRTTAMFPDLWTIRLMRISTTGLLAGSVVSLMLLGAVITSFYKLGDHAPFKWGRFRAVYRSRPQ